jgi:CHAD domain-containing protein
MAYHFERDMDTVEGGVRKIAVELIDDAIDATDGKRNGQVVVHSLRKTCKKLRGLLRLVRPVFDGYQVENSAFRNAGRGLSQLRDAMVLIETYDSLLDAFDDQIDRRRFAAIRRRLTLQQKAVARHADVRGRLETTRDAMKAARTRVRRWRLAKDGFDAIEAGFARSYKGARRAMAAASEETTPEAVHEWRKRVKDHWYHSRLLSPVWPRVIKAYRADADELGELLGQHHDLEVFKQRLVEDNLAASDDLKLLTALVQRRQDMLTDDAFLLGARLLAEPAKAATKRWRSYWDAWRSDEPQATALAA